MKCVAGYLFSRPIDVRETENFIRSSHHTPRPLMSKCRELQSSHVNSEPITAGIQGGRALSLTADAAASPVIKSGAYPHLRA